MNTPWLDSGVRHIAVGSISAYQKYISPHKGFSCAHRLLHGGESCSQYIKRMVAQAGLTEAIKASRQRFQECREANQILKARISSSHAHTEANKKKKEKANHVDNCPVAFIDLSCCECGLDGLDCVSSLPDISSCDLPDCGGGVDCSGFDCGALDCGSCG